MDTAHQVNILLVDDQESNLLALEALLEPLGQNLVTARSGEEALRRLLDEDFAVVLLDVRMGGMDGFEVARTIRGRPRSRNTPIIFVTAFEGEDFSPAQAYTLGAVDYLVKPLVPEILRAKVEVFVQLYQRTDQLRRLERRQSEDEALRRFRAVIEHSWDALALIGPDGIIRYASPSTTRILGYAPEQFIGHNLFEFMHPDDLGRTQGLFAQLLAQPGGSISAPYRFRHQDGSWRWLEGTGTNLLDEPSVRAIVGNYRDITERRESEHVRAELAAIVESSEDAIIGQDLRGVITSWNRGAERLYGYTAEEVVGKPLSLLVPPEQPDELPALLERLTRGERVEHYRTVRMHKDGTRVEVSLGISPIRDAEGRVVGAAKIARDIGPQKRLEDELRRRAEALAEAGRQKDQFLATLAHELRNPLAPILTGLRVLRQPRATPEAREQTRDMIERQVRHLSRLVDDLLDVSRITRGQVQLHRERLDLGRLARTVAEDRRPVLERVGLSLAVETPDTPVWVLADATRLSQVVNNLLDNALKFRGEGRRVTVRVGTHPGDRRAVLTVRDEGIGIEPEVLPRLFDPFAQADRSLDRPRGGLGLGLALVKGLVELHGGEVGAASEGAGRGAEFTVRLPLEREPAPLAQKPSDPPPRRGRLRVLIVEDNRDAADSLKILLELFGQEVRIAYSGTEGVQAAEQWRPDVVLCDIGLPEMDGYGVARELRLNPTTARVRLLALTGYGAEEDKRRSREAGFDHHLVKPADPEELLRLLASG